MQDNTFVKLDDETLKKIDVYLEKLYEKNYTTGKENNLGKLMAETGLGSSQVRGLEQLTFSSTRFSQVINYIKNQAGKEKKEKSQWTKIAPKLINQLGELEQEAYIIVNKDPAIDLLSQAIDHVNHQAEADKSNQEKWSKIAPRLIKRLKEAISLSNDKESSDAATVLEIKMRLARGLMKMIVANYYYSQSQQSIEGE
jgi:delta 1-pyrroline-5-carboxylate dehydrogenase